MKAILIDYKGFRKEVSINERRDTYELAVLPNINWTGDFDPSEVVSFEKITFYYERQFWDENKDAVLIYKERL